jgi:hypothetical protein
LLIEDIISLCFNIHRSLCFNIHRFPVFQHTSFPCVSTYIVSLCFNIHCSLCFNIHRFPVFQHTSFPCVSTYIVSLCFNISSQFRWDFIMEVWNSACCIFQCRYPPCKIVLSKDYTIFIIYSYCKMPKYVFKSLKSLKNCQHFCCQCRNFVHFHWFCPVKSYSAFALELTV